MFRASRTGLESASVRALEAVRDWPVDTVAVGVVAADGHVLGEYGPQEHVFELASVTKLLTAYAALIAVEEGALGLDDSAGPPESTIRHLLAHASGVAPDAAGQLLKVGTGASTPSAEFEILADAVEAATGMKFAVYLGAGVLEPLGMSSSQLAGSPAAGARSSVADLRRFVAELQQPRLLASETVQAATSVVFPGLAGVLPGYGRQDPNDWGSVTRSVTPKHRTGPGRRAHRRPTGTLAAAALSCGSTRLPAVAASASPTAISATGRSTPGRY